MRKLIHTRTITIKAYDEGDGTTSIEGKLEDVQPPESGYFKRPRRPDDPRPQGILHGMSARFKVDNKTAELLRAEGQLPYAPYLSCPAFLPRLQELEGLRLAGGFMKALRERLGGTLGCLHMNTLLTAMANTQGAAMAYYMGPEQWAQMAQRQPQKGGTRGSVHLNSCHMWREKGPLLTALAQGKNILTDNV